MATRTPTSSRSILSMAVGKANTAVQLDNAANHEGARRCYIEAVELLQRVISQTPDETQMSKLQEIQRTYKNRARQLDELMTQAYHVGHVDAAPAET